MRCVLCSRPLVAAAVTLAGKPVGPRCAKKAGIWERKPRKVAVEVVRFVDPAQIDWLEASEG